MKSPSPFVVCGLALLFGSAAALADVTPYLDRAAWDQAVAGSAVFVETFDEFVVDQSLDPPVDLGPCTLQHVGGLISDGRSAIDAPPYMFDTIDDTPGVEFWVNDGIDSAEILFDEPVWAFGADWLRAGNAGNPVTITAYDAAGTTLFTMTLNDGSNLFLGFTTSPPESVSRITLTNTINDGFRVDNMVTATLAEAADPLSLLADLRDELLSLGLPPGLQGSLLAKLNAAEMILTDVVPGNDHAATNILQAFINQATAQSGKKIPAEDADALIAAAQQIIDMLDEAAAASPASAWGGAIEWLRSPWRSTPGPAPYLRLVPTRTRR